MMKAMNTSMLNKTNSKRNSEPDVAQTEAFGSFDIDGLIKFVLVTTLAVMPFFFQKTVSFSLLTVYLILLTTLSRIKPRTLLVSASSYCIIVLVPYLFGLLINGLMSLFFDSNLLASYQGPDQILLRLFRLFVIWYVSILYFYTTPMKTVLGLLDKLLFPLKLAGLPVQDYLKVVMCSVLELKETGTELKKSLAESMRSVIGGHGQFKLNIKGLSQIIVSMIVNSFGKLDKLERIVENVKPEELYSYRFRLSSREAVVISSFALFLASVLIVEKWHW